MVDNYDDLDEMTGSMKDWVSKKQGASVMARITPAKKDKVFVATTKVSADPQNPTVSKIIEALKNNDLTTAKGFANTSVASQFLNEFITEYVIHGGQAEGKWLFVRQIQKGAKGKTAPVKVELSYDKDGDMNVVDVPKSMIYAVDGRKWRKMGIDNLLPKQSVESTPDSDLNPPSMPDVSGDSLVSDDNPVPSSADGMPVSDSASTPASPEDVAPPMPEPTDDDPLIELIGGETVEVLNRLGLRDGVKIDKSVDMGTFKIINGKNSQPIRIIGENGKELEISGFIKGSQFGPTDGEGNYTAFSPANMGSIVKNQFNSFLAEIESKDGKEQMVEQLRDIRKHMDSLSRVFGFDDPQQLEAFFCAWLMKDSTCRLTGIPGTGKTTVINSAATVLANSYGYNVGKRYIKDFSLTAQSGDYLVFPAGQDYDVNYGDKNFQKVYKLWDAWRFTDWEMTSMTSGSYLYDFRFLQRTSDSGYAKNPMEVEDFSKFLLSVPANNKITSNPIKVSNLKILFGSKGLPQGITEKGGFAIYLQSPLYTDAGGNEGYVLREFLLEHFYDNRLDSGSEGMGLISDEMLNECGVAKIDYDKRAEEILYGIEIRQITKEDDVSGETVASYQFDPTPRKVVTQPVKFFNEANRSGSGVEDAILGLIAEKTVEYRGQTFKSPSFIAWMDTNPHQKGNDLAFVDRIDMELYFGTLSLGGRFNTLVERYGGKESQGSRPEFQLMQRMFGNFGDKGFLKPMRFKNLSSVWGTVNSLPFNSSGVAAETSGALLDISMLSVLFTQRYMIQGKEDAIMGQNHTFKDDNDVFASPLADISTTTNSQYESQHPAWIDIYGSSGEAIQAPVLITRMLGFRFSNSLIKMTRAMAFLRGKDHVTRQEVIDAMPYCLGHRLGPAREGEDPKGRDIGIMREGMTVSNEQNFVKDIIMDGYVLRNTNSIMGDSQGKPSLFDLWDSYMQNCSTYMQSTDAYWKYESKVLIPLKGQVRNGGTGITPVHWSIGTMIPENERRTDNYKSLYSSYQERIQRPASEKGTKDTSEEEQKAQLLADTSISQYMKVRGDIAGEVKLFSDDKAKLLSLVDSKIDSISGKSLTVTPNLITANFMAIAPTEGAKYTLGAGSPFKAFDDKIGGPSAVGFKWRCYGDGMGAWGRMVTNGTNASAKIAKLGEDSQNLLDINGADFEANQNVQLSASFIIPTQGESAENGTFDAKMDKLLDELSANTFNGVQIGEVKTGIYGVTDNYADLDEFKNKASYLLNEWLSKTAKKQSETDALMRNGFNACFRLSHLGESVAESMSVTMADGSVKDIDGEDELRLWLSLRCIQGDNKNEGGSATVSLFIGVTSACMRPVRGSNGSMTLDSNDNPVAWEILPFTTDDTYNMTLYSGTEDQWKEFMYQDVGNLTTRDYRLYQQLMMESIL